MIKEQVVTRFGLANCKGIVEAQGDKIGVDEWYGIVVSLNFQYPF